MRLCPEEPPAGPWRIEALVDLIGFLSRRWPADRTAVMAIDGRGSSGKTTLAEKIRRTAGGVAVVHTDDIAWHHSVFGWVDLLLDGVLAPIREGLSVAYRPPAWEIRNRPGSIDVPRQARLLVIEGVGAGRQELTDWLDDIIWVQSDLDVTLARDDERIRAGETSREEYDRWMAEEHPFQAAQRTWERATVIVNGTAEQDGKNHVLVSGVKPARPR